MGRDPDTDSGGRGWSISLGLGGFMAAFVAFVGLTRNVATQDDIREAIEPLEARINTAGNDGGVALSVARDHGAELQALRDEIAALRGSIGGLRNQIVEHSGQLFRRSEFEPVRMMLVRDIDRLEKRADEIERRLAEVLGGSQ